MGYALCGQTRTQHHPQLFLRESVPVRNLHHHGAPGRSLRLSRVLAWKCSFSFSLLRAQLSDFLRQTERQQATRRAALDKPAGEWWRWGLESRDLQRSIDRRPCLLSQLCGKRDPGTPVRADVVDVAMWNERLAGQPGQPFFQAKRL